MDELILQRVGRGDASAVPECIDTYAPLVMLLARRLLPAAADHDDAVQEVFVEIWRNAPRFDPAIASGRAFVAMLARRRLIDRARREGRRVVGVRGSDEPSLGLRAASPSSETAATIGEEALAATIALDELSTDQQLAIRLCVVDGLSHQQAADRTGQPLGTIKTNLRRGLIRVRELLGAMARPEGVLS